MKKIYKRIMAAGMAAVMIGTGNGSMCVLGAEADVAVDETMYVNLDFYGKIDKINVVKGVSLNGKNQFTDYGTYETITNMSNSAEPLVEGDAVTWTFAEAGKERFYYKGSLDKDQVVLPWDFDISYKWNGVPTDGDKLAGVSGLVEIHIQAVPNEKAREYDRNNMLLMAAVPVDMGKCYSVEAEGAQTQNLGETTAAVFTALPGEEGDYTVRIGTDCFESTGVILAMTPGTAEDLEHIKDLKEAKDTWQDAGDQLYDSLEQMARSVESMRQGVGEVKDGLGNAESARQKWSSAKDRILAGNDQTLAALTSVSGQLEAMIPHIQTAKESSEVVHQSMGDIVKTLGDMQDPLRKLETRLNNIKSSTEGLSESIPELTDLMQQLIALDAKLQASQQAYITGIGNTLDDLSELEEWEEEELEEEEEEEQEEEREMENKDNGTDQEEGTGQENVSDQEPEADREDSGGKDSGTGQDKVSDQEPEAGKEDSSADSSEEDSQIISRIERHYAPMVSAPIPGITMDTSELLRALMERKDYLEEISETSGHLSSLMSNLMDDTSDSAKYSAELVDSMDYFIEDLTALHDSLDSYYPDFQTALDDSSELVSRMTAALNQGVSTMTIVQETLKSSSNDMDASLRESLKGSMELLEKSLSVLDSTAALREAGRVMKDTVDSQLDKFDTENRFLFMDPSAEKCSFTSDKNKPPKTLQIVLRTDEISLDKEEKKAGDAETEKKEESPLRRMWNVLVRMWKAIVDIFKNR